MKRIFFGVMILWVGFSSLACQSPPPEATAETPAPAPPAKVVLPVDPVFDETAKFLAARPCQTPALAAFQETAEYKAFAAALDQNWTDLEANRLQPMREWAATEIVEAEAATTCLFYPFGGPDALTAELLFPRARNYVLLGLEFVGRLPEFKVGGAKSMAAYFQNLQVSLKDFFNKSYFITKNMNAALTGDKVDGILPLLCFFLKRTGNVVSAV